MQKIKELGIKLPTGFVVVGLSYNNESRDLILTLQCEAGGIVDIEIPVSGEMFNVPSEQTGAFGLNFVTPGHYF